MGFSENDIRGDFNLPQISLSNLNEIPTNTDKESIQFKILMSDEETELDRLNVWINDVAVFGSNGISLKNKRKREMEYALELEIADGPNKIEFSSLNASDSESYKSTVQIEKTPSGKSPNL